MLIVRYLKLGPDGHAGVLFIPTETDFAAYETRLEVTGYVVLGAHLKGVPRPRVSPDAR